MPGGSEALMVYQLTEAPGNWLAILLVATLGNFLGSVITYAMGWWIAGRYHPFNLDQPKHERARRLIDRYGVIALLLAWLPIVGDPLCLLAGWLKINWKASFLFILLGKFLRYAVLVWLSLQLI